MSETTVSRHYKDDPRRNLKAVLLDVAELSRLGPYGHVNLHGLPFGCEFDSIGLDETGKHLVIILRHPSFERSPYGSRIPALEASLEPSGVKP